MNKNFYIISLIVFGFFLKSNMIFACNNYSEKNSFKKEASCKTESKNCCNDNSKGQKSKGCHGKCGHSNCTVSSVHAALIAPFSAETKTEFSFLHLENENFKNLKTTVSDGFHSLWIIPKIG